MGQLQDISQQQLHRGRGRSHPHRGGPHRQRFHHQNQASFDRHQPNFPPSNVAEHFPPLGSNPSTSTRPGQSATQAQWTQQNPQFPPHPQPYDNRRHASPREFQELARGNHRGRQAHFGPRQQHPQQGPQSDYINAYGRPPHRQGYLFDPNAGTSYGNTQQQQQTRHRIMKQCDYLTAVGRRAYVDHKLQREESTVKEAFRQELETVAIDALAASYPTLDVSQVKLKCYGSLANGFALAGCDMDLLLSLPEYSASESQASFTHGSADSGQAIEDNFNPENGQAAFKAEVQLLLGRAFLDRNYGARLLTKTRVPILRICQTPGPELLDNLRQNQTAEECSFFKKRQGSKDSVARAQIPPASEISDEPSTTTEAVETALAELTITDAPPSSTANPKSRGNIGLEFIGDVGIQCDINFGNFVALHNSALLRAYHSFDPRVGELGIFIKIWAKARDINTPYRGTLSSYGYILMVLHYLMNIVNPPIIPNLQALAKTEDSWYPERKIPLFEGFDVRFLRNPQDIDTVRSKMVKNNESAGQLLRGFFKYYGTKEGFHWTRDVISIRQQGGHLTKAQKGWTEAKWAETSSNQVRLRYLLAIEDPFEVEHNVARTVGHHGIVAIRDECRRAWSIIERIGTADEVPIEEFLAPVSDRGDTLRKDKDFHRQRQAQMKQDLEAKERALMHKVADEGPDASIDGMSGTLNHEHLNSPTIIQGHHPPTRSKLTSMTSPQAQTRESQYHRRNMRQVKIDTDDEGDDDNYNNDGDDMAMTVASSDAGSFQSETQTTPESLKSDHTPRAKVGSGSNLSLLFGCPRYGFDSDGKIIAWDVDDQDGRWLHWRDGKVRRGAKLHFSNPALQELHEKNPYHADRPNPYIDKPYNNQFENWRHRSVAERPPWPAPPTNDAVTGAQQFEESDDKLCYDNSRIESKAAKYATMVEVAFPPASNHASTSTIGSSNFDSSQPDNSVGIGESSASMTLATSTSWELEPASNDQWATNPSLEQSTIVPSDWNEPITHRLDMHLTNSKTSVKPNDIQHSSTLLPADDARRVTHQVSAHQVAGRSNPGTLAHGDADNTTHRGWYKSKKARRPIAAGDAQTTGGRWLTSRDGSRQVDHNPGESLSRTEAQLVERFPVNPNIQPKFAEKNQELQNEHSISMKRVAEQALAPDAESNSMESVFERKAISTQNLQDSSSKRPPVMSFEKTWDEIAVSGVLKTSATQGPLTAARKNEPTAFHTSDLTSQAAGTIEPTPGSAIQELDSQFVRAQRLAFFTSANSKTHLTAETSLPENTNAELDDSSDMGMPTRMQSHSSNLLSILLASSKNDHNGAPVTATRTSLPDDRRSSTWTSSNDEDKKNAISVPPTLFPDAQDSERPRDEDPQIMPIPQALGFQFDPRQVQDLVVIAKGGNGCARDGAKFSIEEDYEWGGGGMMGYRESTGDGPTHESSASVDHVPGTGDSEGLLKELPGVLDEQ